MSTSTLTAPDALIPEGNGLPDLTGYDRCDHGGCNAQAYVRVRLPGSPSDLVFCGHDYAKHESAFFERGALIRDERERLLVSYSEVEATELEA